MGPQIYKHLPKTRFLYRMLLPGIGVLLFGFVLLDLIPNRSNEGSDAPDARGPAGLVVTQPNGSRLSQWVYQWKHIPAGCESGRALHSLQEEQCKSYWSRLYQGTAIFLIPFAMMILFWMIGMDQLSTIYRKGRKKFEKPGDLIQARVTSQRKQPNDFFAWFFCFHRISVEIQGKRTVVYLPEREPVPRKDQTVLVSQPVTLFGKPRYFSMLHAPHLAVFAGSRT